MKTCTKCNKEQPLTDFVKDKRRVDGRSSWCLGCNRLKSKSNPESKSRRQKYYLEHREQINEKNRANWKKNKEYYKVSSDLWKQENRSHLLKYYQSRFQQHRLLTDSLKTKPCQDCGKSFPPFCMEFDHVRGEKRFAIGKMANHSRIAVSDEISKCELVCCGCHRIRTQSRKGASNNPKVKNFRVWLNALKDHPCMDCSVTLPPEAMDFDHVQKGKVVGIAQMWSWSRDKVLIEVAKCELVCCICHRIRTMQRRALSPSIEVGMK